MGVALLCNSGGVAGGSVSGHQRPCRISCFDVMTQKDVRVSSDGIACNAKPLDTQRVLVNLKESKAACCDKRLKIRICSFVAFI